MGTNMIDKKIITNMINKNYHVLLAFEMADGNLTWKEYLKKLEEKSQEKI